MQSGLRTAAAGLIGNVLEWFDYAVYGYFSTEIGAQFFPDSMGETDKTDFFYLCYFAQPGVFVVDKINFYPIDVENQNITGML